MKCDYVTNKMDFDTATNLSRYWAYFANWLSYTWLSYLSILEKKMN